jgi:alpha-mannosidase
VRIGLDANSPRVDVEILFENRAEDHRLRVIFPSGVDSDSVSSHGHFDVLDRSLIKPMGVDWVQPPPDTFPQGDVSWVTDERHGIAVMNQGLPELGCSRRGDGTLELEVTLLRSVGWLSRDDFPTRRNQNAGPTIATPEAQCLGPHRYRLAVLPFTRSPFDRDLPVTIPGTVLGATRRWRTPLPCVQGVGGRAVGMGPFFVASWPVEVTAVKRHEERDTLVVRVWNPRPDEVEVELLCFWAAIQGAWHVNLLEERGEAIEDASRHAVTFPLKGRTIATIELELRRPR